MGVQGEAVWNASRLLVYLARNSSFLPVLSPWAFGRVHLTLLPSLLPQSFSLVISCGGPFLALVSDGPHSFLQWSGWLCPFMSFTAAFVEMVPTGSLLLLCSLFLPLSLQNFTQGEKNRLIISLLVYLSSLSACIVSDHINLTISLLNFLLYSWLLIIQAIYESMQAFCWSCTEVYQLFSIISV